METNNKPATPLPWNFRANGVSAPHAVIDGATAVGISHGMGSEANQNFAYIAHTSNAYPKLVEALKLARADLDAMYGMLADGRIPVVSIGAFKRRDGIKALLRELGEES